MLFRSAPHVNFFIQKVNVPRISLRPIETPSPFIKIPYSGEHMDYANLQVTFKVDEKLQNYLEIHNWLRSLGKPHDFEEFAEIEKHPSVSGDGIFSDITISVLSVACVKYIHPSQVKFCPELTVPEFDEYGDGSIIRLDGP